MENDICNASRPAAVPFIVHENALMRAERQMKRMWIALIVMVVAIVMIVGGFLWYLNQYDFVSSEDVTVDGTNGVANYVGGDGAIYNGENSNQADAYSTEEEWEFEGNT